VATRSATDVAQLVQAASGAARAAGDAVVALREHQAARSSTGRFQEAAKVSRQPGPFGSEAHEDDLGKWQDFTVNFRAWLFYGNKLFEQDLHRIESVHADSPIVSVAGEPQEAQDCCSHWLAERKTTAHVETGGELKRL